MFKSFFKFTSKADINSEKVLQAKKFQDKSYFWNPNDGVPNVGDYLAYETVDFLLRMRDIHPNEISTGKILSIGSVLHFANDGDVIWGTGRNGKVEESLHKFGQLDVRAVRGPLTKKYLEDKGIKVPEVFGDPGILAPLIYPREILNTVYPAESVDLVIVPQLNDNLDKYAKYKDKLISPRQLPATFLASLVKAKKVIASSLHGLILAEAYGIPAVYFNSGSGENIFKYQDYYRGTGRDKFEMGDSIEECMELSTDPIPNISELQTNLIKSFPFDRYGS